MTTLTTLTTTKARAKVKAIIVKATSVTEAAIEIVTGTVKTSTMATETTTEKEMSIETSIVTKTPATTATAITALNMTDIANTKMKCSMCQKCIDLIGRSAHSFLNKITTCYGTSTIVHTKFATNFSKIIDCSYEFDSETYGADSAMTLYCAQCEQKCLYCGKNHIINNAKVSGIVCTKCQKNWSYHMKPTCKNTYEKSNSTAPVYKNCDVANRERENISILRISFPKLQSQYVSPISLSVHTTDLIDPIINLINDILNNDGNSLDKCQNVKECEEFLNLHLTHLYTIKHNMLSPNFPLVRE